MTIQQPESAVLTAPWNKPSLIFVAFIGGILTVAMMIAMRGSAWPTAAFILAGFFLPLLIAIVTLRLGIRHFPRLLALGISLAFLGTIAWVGKHPSPQNAFHDITGIDLPTGAKIIDIDRGWYDGRTTMVRFQADPKIIRQTMLKIDALHGVRNQDKNLDEDMRDGDYKQQWQMAVCWLTPVCPKYYSPLPWTTPRHSRWMLQTPSGDRLIAFLWDDATGEALVYDGTD